MKLYIQRHFLPLVNHPPITTQKSQQLTPFKNYKLDTIMAGSEIGAWTFNEKLMKLTVCPTFQRLMNLPLKNAYSLTELFRLIKFSEPRAVLRAIQRACQSEASFSIELMVNAQSGSSSKWYEIRGKSYRKSGKATTFMGTLTDVTGTKTKQLWANDQLALLSHELKSPLSAIKLYLQRAGKIYTDSNLQDATLFLQKADDQVAAMISLMDDFLSFTAAGNVRMKLYQECFDICALIKGIAAQFQLQHPCYQFKIKAANVLKVIADRRKIAQVMNNYLTNAVKYSPLHSTIEVCCSETGDGIQIEVTDQGIGIGVEHHDRIFERYFRTPGTNAKGFGLGLYLVKEIVNRHGGDVWVDSEVNKGSSFFFTLPFPVSTSQDAAGF